MTFLKPCQWTVCSSNRSGRWARPTFVSWTRKSWPSRAQKSGAECWALLFRLNYSIDLRYGVIHDIAQKIRSGVPVDVTMGHVNMIWQGDACSQALRCLLHCESPAMPLNVSGPETVSVRWMASELGKRMGREPTITGEEADRSWLTNTMTV